MLKETFLDYVGLRFGEVQSLLYCLQSENEEYTKLVWYTSFRRALWATVSCGSR